MVGFRVRAPTARWCESRLDEGRKYLARDQAAEPNAIVAVVKQRAEDARDVVPNNRDCHLIGGAAPCASQSEKRGRGRKRVVFLSPLLSSMYDGGMPVVCMANSVIAASNEPTRRASKGRNGPRSEKTAPRRALRETARAHLRHGIHQILREQHETARRREQEHVADHAAAASWAVVLQQVES